MNFRYYVLLLLVLTISTGCAEKKLTVRKTVMFATIEDFKPGPDGGVDLVWSTARISDFDTLRTTLQEHDSLMPGQTWLVIDKQSSASLDDKQVLKISRQMVHAIKTKLGHGFKLVDKPTGDTLRLSIVLTNLETPNPVFSVTNSLLPETLGTSTLSKIVMAEDTRGGGVTVELLVSDARTNEPLIVVIDKRFGNSDIGSMANSPDDVQEAINQWVERLWTTLSYWNWI